jgi:RHS repeat-associated protein
MTVTHGYSTFGIPSWTTTPLATQVYSYDNANRLTSETDAEGTASFSYDNANELTGVTGSRTESYSYDSNGNRTGTGWSTTVMNEIATSPGPITYTFDNAGNMITSKSGSTTTTYTYDFRNRLTGVNQGGTLIATYTYNALDQRIGVKDSGTQTWTVYDGQSPDANPYADFNGSRNLTMRYLLGPGVVNGAVMSVILGRTSSGGTTAWYLTDKLGSVRDIVSTSGTVIDHVAYDSFGNIVTETNASNGDRFKFAGMQFDATIGHHYDRARWYSSAKGSFNSLDPIAFASMSSNLYTYNNNGPTNDIDPSGEVSILVTGVGGMVIGGLVGAISTAIKNPNAGFDQYLEAIARGALVGLVSGLTMGAVAAIPTAIISTGMATVAGGVAGGVVGDITDQLVGMATGVQMYFDQTRTIQAAVLSILSPGTLRQLGFGVRSAISRAERIATLLRNNANGGIFETQGIDYLKSIHTQVVRRVSVRPRLDNGKLGGRFQTDAMSIDPRGRIRLNEFKSSPTAGFTPRQKVGLPLVRRNGGVVVGDAGGRDYPRGMVIDPTPVDVHRPSDFLVW